MGTPPRFARWIPIVALALLTGPGAALHAGSSFVLTADDIDIDPGSTFSFRVFLDNPDPVDAFQFGLQHVATHLTLVGIAQGSVVAATNGGAGADYFYSEIDPDGDPGGVV
ncbi:MAG: hypothetical protein KDC38_09340, partial [Planctomycetes bacterium]|nr:hypothetical protein [Planctomycetota bacterium]